MDPLLARVTPKLVLFVVRGGQLSVFGEGDPLPPLVGGCLSRIRVDAGELPRIGCAPREGQPAVVGDADQDVVVAGPDGLDPGVEILAGALAGAGRRATVRFL